MTICSSCERPVGRGYGECAKTLFAHAWFECLELEARGLRSALGNLLAVIHGDGGHHCLEHGFTKSAKEATVNVVMMRSRASDLNSFVECVGEVFEDELLSSDEGMERIGGALNRLHHP